MNSMVKTFRAPDPRAALAAVKEAFGEEAVILQTREVGGGLWGKAEIEITAARTPQAAQAEKPAPQQQLEGEIASLRRIVEELRHDLRRSREEGAAEPPTPPALLRLHKRLVARGMEEPLAQEIVRLAQVEAGSLRDPDLLNAAAAQIKRRLAPGRAPWERSESRVLALVGPTGVGKTTTIAKIAARALLETRLKVSLITVDTYRIGASEHIGRYGEIMGVPTYIARDTTSLRDAVARSSEADLVLVDTAGRPDAPAIATQMELLRTIPGLELHLVLSAASGARELRAAARRYERCGVHRVIFSKLDEADGPASVLSGTSVIARPISCVTDGQRVPEDVHPGSSPRLLEMVLGR